MNQEIKKKAIIKTVQDIAFIICGILFFGAVIAFIIFTPDTIFLASMGTLMCGYMLFSILARIIKWINERYHEHLKELSRQAEQCIPLYGPVCPKGYTDCVYDPAYIRFFHTEQYLAKYGRISPEEVAKKECNCNEDDAGCSFYKREDN